MPGGDRARAPRRVVKTSGKAGFIAGADVREFQQSHTRGRCRGSGRAWGLCAVERLPCPTVAAINGFASAVASNCARHRHRVLVDDPKAVLGLPRSCWGYIRVRRHRALRSTDWRPAAMDLMRPAGRAPRSCTRARARRCVVPATEPRQRRPNWCAKLLAGAPWAQRIWRSDARGRCVEDRGAGREAARRALPAVCDRRSWHVTARARARVSTPKRNRSRLSSAPQRRAISCACSSCRSASVAGRS